MLDKVLKVHSFAFNKEDNGGEQLIITTKVIPNGDPGVVYLKQEISLQSYCNSASFNLSGCQITPDILRQLANELETTIIQAKAKIA